jgi:hypothetical protein
MQRSLKGLPFHPNSPNSILPAKSSYIKGHNTSNSTISHRDAATLHYINVSVGYLSGTDWETFLTKSIQNKNHNFNTAFQLLQAAYMMESHKDNFWSYHHILWQTLIWNTYRNTLFHDPFTPSSLVYNEPHNISNQMDPTDLFWPFHAYLEKGSIPSTTLIFKFPQYFYPPSSFFKAKFTISNSLLI